MPCEFGVGFLGHAWALGVRLDEICFFNAKTRRRKDAKNSQTIGRLSLSRETRAPLYWLSLGSCRCCDSPLKRPRSEGALVLSDSRTSSPYLPGLRAFVSLRLRVKEAVRAESTARADPNRDCSGTNQTVNVQAEHPSRERDEPSLHERKHQPDQIRLAPCQVGVASRCQRGR